MSMLRRPLWIILAILLALAAIEGIAWWWMHPAPAGLGQPVLAYRPSRSVGVPPTDQESVGLALRVGRDSANGVESESADIGQRSEVRRQKEAPASAHDPAPGTSSNQQSTFHNQQSSIPSSSPSQRFSVSAFQLLPEVVSRSIPSLRCSTGTAARINRDDGIIVHVAFFEWELAASNNVLEAFKHLPEECMGSIGMTLVKIHPPRSYVIGRDASPQASDSSHADSTSKIQNSELATQSLSFDHTEFRDSSGKPIHAFKGVWVSGASTILGDGLRGGLEQWRQIRWRAALKRFRPAHARVAQGAIRGIANPDRAWEIFEESMLRDLTFER